MAAADWEYWEKMYEVTLFEACSLALNRDPRSAPDWDYDWKGEAEFDNLMTQLKSNRSNSDYFKEPTPDNTVHLDEFAGWCLYIGLEIPEELEALVKKKQQQIGKRQPVANQQNDAILNWLKSNKYDPLKLPVPPPGKAGVKKICRDALCENSKQLFLSADVFNTAWERLRSNDEITDTKQ